jgi:hypothetical protein
MYAQSFFTTCGLGIGPLPITAARSALTFIGFINLGFGFLFAIEMFYLIIIRPLFIILPYLYSIA